LDSVTEAAFLDRPNCLMLFRIHLKALRGA